MYVDNPSSPLHEFKDSYAELKHALQRLQLMT